MATAPKPPRRRNWFAFRLRTLLAAVTLFAVSCATYSVYIRPYREEQRLWESLLQKWAQSANLGNALVIKAEFVGDSAVPQFLRDGLGPEAFRFVRKLELLDGHLTGEITADLSRFEHLEALTITKSTVDNDFLRGISSLPKLQSLAFRHSSFVDGSLEPLGACRGLRELIIQRTNLKLGNLKPLADSSVERIEMDGKLTNEILSAGHPYELLVLANPLFLEGVSEAGLQGLAAFRHWRDFEDGEEHSLHLSQGTLSSTGVGALYAMPISRLYLHEMNLALPEQQRLFRDLNRSWTCVADSQSLSPRAFAQSHAGEVSVDIGAARIAFRDAEYNWMLSLTHSEWLEVFACLPHLETLRADATADAEHFDLWLSPPRLRTLEIRTNRYRTLNLQALRRAPNLEKLTVFHDGSDPNQWNVLRDLTRLTTLRLWNASRDEIDRQTLREVVAAKTITTLHLGNWLPRDEHLQELASAAQLRELHIYGDERASAEAWKELAVRLPHLNIQHHTDRSVSGERKTD